MASIDDKRSGMEEDKKEDEFSTGPLSVLMHSVKHNSQVCNPQVCTAAHVSLSMYHLDYSGTKVMRAYT